MSVRSYFFIEVKDKVTNKWTALTHYVPFRDWPDDKPDILNPPLKKRLIELDYGGYVRDVFSNSFESQFNSRGKPSDISDECAEYFNNEDKKAGERKYVFPSYWSITFATLEEISDYADEALKEWKRKVSNCAEEKFLHNRLMAKMDDLISLFNKEEKRVSNENDEVDYTWEYYFTDALYDILALNDFVECIRNMVDSIYYGYDDFYSDSEIRVVSYNA